MRNISLPHKKGILKGQYVGIRNSMEYLGGGNLNGFELKGVHLNDLNYKGGFSKTPTLLLLTLRKCQLPDFHLPNKNCFILP